MLGDKRVATTIPVRDPAQARSFYEGTLGLKVSRELPDGGIESQCGGGTTVYTYPTEQNAGQSPATLATIVPTKTNHTRMARKTMKMNPAATLKSSGMRGLRRRTRGYGGNVRRPDTGHAGGADQGRRGFQGTEQRLGVSTQRISAIVGATFPRQARTPHGKARTTFPEGRRATDGMSGRQGCTWGRLGGSPDGRATGARLPRCP